MSHDTDIIAANEIYETARAEMKTELDAARADVESAREDGYALGIIKTLDYDIEHKRLMKYLVLGKIKERKEYRQAGMTWAAFCQSIGESDRTVDRTLAELKPLHDAFSAKLADLMGLDLNTIRKIGKSVSANLAEIEGETLVVDGEKIPLTPDNADELKDALERLIAAKNDQLKDKDSTIAAKERLLAEKAKSEERLHKDIARLESRGTAKLTDATPEEEEAYVLLERINREVTALFSTLTASLKPGEISPATARRAYMTVLYVGKLAADYRMRMLEHYEDADEVPWEVQDAEVPPLADMMPHLAGFETTKRNED